MLKNLILHLIAGVLAVFLIVWLVPNVEYNGSVKIVIETGLLLGLANFFVKPVLKIISLPLRIITLGAFSIIINLFLVWLVINVLSSIEIKGLLSLLMSTFIVWILNLIVSGKNK